MTDCRVLLLELDSDDSPELLLLVLELDSEELDDVLTDAAVLLDEDDRTGDDEDSDVVESDDVVTDAAVLLDDDDTDVELLPLVVDAVTAVELELELDERFVSELDEDDCDTEERLVLLLVTDAAVLLEDEDTDGDDWLDDDV